jgi:hypothetical protein
MELFWDSRKNTTHVMELCKFVASASPPVSVLTMSGSFNALPWALQQLAAVARKTYPIRSQKMLSKMGNIFILYMFLLVSLTIGKQIRRSLFRADDVSSHCFDIGTMMTSPWQS